MPQGMVITGLTKVGESLAKFSIWMLLQVILDQVLANGSGRLPYRIF